jgi:hypothetical protein
MGERAHAPVTYDPIEQSCEVQGDEKQYKLLEEGGEHLEAFDRDGSLCEGSGKWGGSECSKQDRVCTRIDSILTWGILKLRGGMGVGGQQSRSPRTSFGGEGAGAGVGGCAAAGAVGSGQWARQQHAAPRCMEPITNIGSVLHNLRVE